MGSSTKKPVKSHDLCCIYLDEEQSVKSKKESPSRKCRSSDKRDMFNHRVPLQVSPYSYEDEPIVKRQPDWKAMFGAAHSGDADAGSVGFKGLRGKRARAAPSPCNIFKLITCY